MKLPIFIVIILILVFLTDLGKAEAANSPIAGALRVPTGLNANTRYFTNNTGKAIYLTGSHTWHNLQDYKNVSLNLPDFDYDKYLDFLLENNHNFIRLWVTTESDYDKDNNISATPSMYLRTTDLSKGLSYDGKPKYDLSKLNPEYFIRLKGRVEKAHAKGVYVSIMFFDSLGAGYAASGDPIDINMQKSNPFRNGNNINGINADTFNTNNNGLVTELHTALADSSSSEKVLQKERILAIQKAYIAEVVKTVNSFDNVLFEIGNELPIQSVAFQNDMIDYVRELEAFMEKKHPIGITSGILDITTSGAWNKKISYATLANSRADWISPTQNLTDTTPDGKPDPRDYLTNPPKADGRKVSIADTDHITPDDPSRNQMWVWKSFTRGHNPIYMDVYQLPFGLYSGQPWNDPVNGGWGNLRMIRQAMGDTKTYADKMNLAAMTPSDNPLDCSTTYCLINPGQEYLVYQPGSGTFTVNLPAGTYVYEWFNPAITPGAVVAGGTRNIATVNDGLFVLPPAILSEAVLYLKKINLAECTDNDRDGYFASGDNCGTLDCNDSNVNIHPLAIEICNDGMDNNCDSIQSACNLSSGLSGYWKMEGNALDSSGNNNSGALLGGISCNLPGKIGQACSFDGKVYPANQANITDLNHISVPDSASLRMTQDLTMAAWINWDGNFHQTPDGREDWSYILEKGKEASRQVLRSGTLVSEAYEDDNYGLGICGHALGNNPCTFPRLFFEYEDNMPATAANNYNNYHLFKGTKAVQKNQWVHVAAVYDSVKKSLTLYQNGEADGSFSVQGFPLKGINQNYPLLIGRQEFFQAHLPFSGLLDEVRIYNRALSQPEISALKNFAPSSADVNGDGRANIKDIQACIKVITNSQPDQDIINNCKAVVPDIPINIANIKDIQEIIRKIINP